MKRFWVTCLFSLMIGSFLTSCAALPPEKAGAATKAGALRQAQEQVAPVQAQEAVVPQGGPAQSK